ncbi:hypothetical protein [Streptomyces sp.]|uniref:hypothetical protein n=1 Tax=Streptomyces sp. TaxID=1931 RepID=UPI002F95CAE1
MTSLDQLLHLVDRAERGVLLPAEAAQLRAALRAMHARQSYDGPSIAECTAADRRWPLEKEGE